MADTRIEHTMNLSEDAFWSAFFSTDYNHALFLGELQFESWKVVSQDDTGDRIERVVDVTPKMPELPGPLKKLAEGGASYRERNAFNKGTKRMTVVVEPSTLQGKLTVSGVVQTQAISEKQCRRIAEFTVTAKVFGIGGMIESKMLSEIRASYDKAAAFTNRWAKEKGL